MPFDANTPSNSTSTPDQNVPMPVSQSGDSSAPPPQVQAQPSTQQVSAGGGQTNQAPSTNQSASQQMVGNTQPADPNADNPLVRHASVIRSIAQQLAGGPAHSVTIDADGNRQVTTRPLKGSEIGMAIALSAIQGSLTGLAAGRGRGPGAAGAAAFQQSANMRLQKQQRDDQLSQEEFQNRSAALVRKAQIAEVNSRSLLNVAEAEKFGADGLDKLIEINRNSGVLDIDPGNLDNGGQPMTQAELLDAMKSGKVTATDQLGPVVGRVQMTNPDGSSRWEGTHLVVKDPNREVPLTQELWDGFAAARVPGFKPGVKIAAGITSLKLSTIQRANEIAASHALSDFRLKDMRDTLAGTQYADKIPASIDFSKPGVETAMQRFQKYVSHSNQHGMDVYESLQAMGADKRNPQTGQMQPNADSKYVDVIAQAFGGWPVLEAVHNQIAADKKVASEFAIVDSEAKANAIIATPKKFTRDQVNSARNFLALSEQQGAKKASQDARARAVAEGKDVEQMLKTGINPITGEKLTLANAPDSMLVDPKGRPVPQNMQSFYKPSQNERQTADTARQALAISADLRAAVQKNPNLVGPLLGNSKKALASLGLGDAQAQKLLDDVSFLQSAATKVHTGRFSSEILKKMSGMIGPGMNPQQFVGGLNSIDEVMQRYAKEDQLVTVADYKQMQQAPTASNAPQLTNLQRNPTTGQQIGWNGQAWVDAKTGKAIQ